MYNNRQRDEMSTGKIVLAYAEKLSESNTHHNADNEKIKQSRTHILGYGKLSQIQSNDRVRLATNYSQ